MMLVALALGAVFTIPVEEPILVLLPLLVPVSLVFAIYAVYSRGYSRTFAMGACFPAFLIYFSPYLFQVLYLGLGLNKIDASSITVQRLIILASFVTVILVFLAHGGLAVLVRWLVERAQEPAVDSEPKVPRAESPFDVETPSK